VGVASALRSKRGSLPVCCSQLEFQECFSTDQSVLQSRAYFLDRSVGSVKVKRVRATAVGLCRSSPWVGVACGTAQYSTCILGSDLGRIRTWQQQLIPLWAFLGWSSFQFGTLLFHFCLRVSIALFLFLFSDHTLPDGILTRVPQSRIHVPACVPIGTQISYWTTVHVSHEGKLRY